MYGRDQMKKDFLSWIILFFGIAGFLWCLIGEPKFSQFGKTPAPITRKVEQPARLQGFGLHCDPDDQFTPCEYRSVTPPPKAK